MTTTRRIRLVGKITPSGDWDAMGWGYPDGNASDEEMLDTFARSSALADEYGATFWVDAVATAPRQPDDQGQLEGAVTEADDG